MKPTIVVSLGGIWLLGLLALLPAAAQDGVFPDKNLESALRTQVFEKRNTDKPLTKEDAKKVYVLKAKGRSIKEITGLEHCINLGEVDLSNNQITDINPLKALKNIQSLDLSGNRIQDISSLTDLSNLQYVGLSDNQITDITPLAKSVNLNALYLSGNQITDITPLKDLKKVWSLYLNGNPLEKIEILGGLRWLSTLDLRECGINDLSPIKTLTGLNLLFLEGNKITDLKDLVEMTRDDAEGKNSFAPFLHLHLKGNPLNKKARDQQIPALQKWGVRIIYEVKGT